jgi:SAM-dependent methyltransferase
VKPLLVRVTRCPADGGELLPAAFSATLDGVAYGMRRCPRCHRGVLDPRPDAEALASWYGPGYFGSGSGKFVLPIEAFVEWFRGRRARQAAALLERGPAPHRSRRILDVGCGSGQFLAALVERGYECHGTELSQETARRAAAVPGLRLHVGPVAPDSYPAGQFDLVSVWHVLEHLEDPDAMLRRCAGWLRSGGWLMLAVPNIDSWQARLYRGSWFHFDPPRHLFHFGPRSLETALTAAGYRVTRMRLLSWEQNLYGVLQSALNALGFPRDDFYEALKGNRRLGSEPRDFLQAALLAVGLLPAAAFCIAEAAARSGGTIECVAIKEPA